MIDLDSITPKQKLVIAKGLCDYDYIMSNWESNDSDFKDVYYSFYLKARWAVMNLAVNKDPYFDELQNMDSNISFMEVLDNLKEKMASHSYEFSLCTKLFHTRNPKKPIYDSKIREYLSKEENVDFWWHTTLKKRESAKSLSERDKIEHDWIELNKWYDSIVSSDRGIKWIKWFDDNFPSYKNISNIKKIDFIIFGTR